MKVVIFYQKNNPKNNLKISNLNSINLRDFLQKK